MKYLALAAVLGGCVKEYKVRVELTPAAADRRLASGKSDSIDGFIRSSDASGVAIQVDGQLEVVPRADIAKVDQKLAKRDVTYGTVFAVGGAALAIGGMIAFQCGENEFPLFCLDGDRNIYAGLAFLGGIALAGAGLKAVFTGKTAQSRTDEILRGGSPQIGVAPVLIGEQPGVGVFGRF